jgi:hypothetical protein
VYDLIDIWRMRLLAVAATVMTVGWLVMAFGRKGRGEALFMVSPPFFAHNYIARLRSCFGKEKTM